MPDVEIVKLLAEGGPLAIILGFMVWTLTPAINKLTSKIERMDGRVELMMTNHMEHLPGRVADEMERRRVDREDN